MEVNSSKNYLPYCLPNRWRKANLGELCGKITTGKLDANAMREGGAFRFYTCSKEFYQIDRYAFDTEAVLVSGNGSNVGYVHYYKGKFNAYQRTYVLSDFSAHIHFIRHFLAANLQERIKKEVNAGITPYILYSTLAEMPIYLPVSDLEQQAIASALSDADALIESLEQLIEKKRQIKQGVMQELLTGKRRLPGFSGEWERKRLGECGFFLKGSGVSKSQTLSGELACVRYGELYTRHKDCIRDYYSWISKEVAQTATRLVRGDILFAGSGETKEEIGKCAAFIDDREVYAGGDIVILRTRTDNPLYLGYYLNTAPVARQKASRGQGDAVVHISSSALAVIEITLPKPAEQFVIAAILSDMEAEIEAVESKLAKARQVKQGMMQDLLTGRVRLV